MNWKVRLNICNDICFHIIPYNKTEAIQIIKFYLYAGLSHGNARRTKLDKSTHHKCAISKNTSVNFNARTKSEVVTNQFNFAET